MAHEATLHVDMGNASIEGPAVETSKPCLLLHKLPGELRNKIWALTLHYPEGLVVRCDTATLVTKKPLAVTASCKQIRRECGDLLFTQNELSLQFPNKKTLRKASGFNHLIARHISLASQFRGMHLAFGQHRSQRFVFFAQQLVWTFRACKKRTIPLRVSFEIEVEDGAIPYEFTMQGREAALAGLDHCGQSAPDNKSVRLAQFAFKECIEKCFDDERGQGRCHALRGLMPMASWTGA